MSKSNIYIKMVGPAARAAMAGAAAQEFIKGRDRGYTSPRREKKDRKNLLEEFKKKREEHKEDEY